MTPTNAQPLIAATGSIPASAVTVPVRGRGGPVTLDAWRYYLTNEPMRPEATSAQYIKGSTADRKAFDAARTRYHRGLADIVTPQMTEAHSNIGSRVDGNDGCPPTARTGIVVNGLPNLGKSTIILRWGADFEMAERAALGCDWDTRTDLNGLFIPVVSVILGLDDGPKGLCQKIMSFYGQHYVERWDQGELTKRIHALTVACGTRVLLIDQMQNLQMRNRSAQQTAAHIKELMDVLPVTIIGAGVAMETTGFFQEGKGQAGAELAQVGGRFGRVDIHASRIDTAPDRKAWIKLLTTVDKRLVLFKKEPGDVPALGEYIYERTGGVTGEVMDLLRRGANEAVGKEERITADVLDRIRLSQRSMQLAELADGSDAGHDDAYLDVAGVAAQRAVKRAHSIKSKRTKA